MFPESLDIENDYIISYLSPWIIPENFLSNTKRAAINFHPASPDYPGIGCTNFAIYDGATTYGVTCHHMAKKVDTGKIIAVREFPVLPTDTVYSLTQRCYAHLLALFYDIFTCIIFGKPLPESDKNWSRKPYKRSELNALCKIDTNMPDDEIKRRVRATTYPNMPGAYVELAGLKFKYAEEE